tara:strand:- start:96 stop:293 length:198 start_codon:yes stop_codon:yes gene_type:complete
MKLQTFKEYTVDYRLRQFRSCPGGWENFGEINFIDFDSKEGQAILCEMASIPNTLDYSKYNMNSI